MNVLKKYQAKDNEIIKFTEFYNYNFVKNYKAVPINTNIQSYSPEKQKLLEHLHCSNKFRWMKIVRGF